MPTEARTGKKPNQKLKIYMIYEYLRTHTGPDQIASAATLISYLHKRGIEAERRSIYRDIDDINKLVYLMENEDASAEDAEDALSSEGADGSSDNKAVLYDKSRKGFYIRSASVNDRKKVSPSGKTTDPEESATYVTGSCPDDKENTNLWHIYLRCDKSLIDTMKQAFSSQDADFIHNDDPYFTVVAKVPVNEAFFGWLLGFGDRVTLMDPEPVVKQFRNHIRKISRLYQ